MAVSESREVVIEAAPEEVMDVIADVESLPEWSDAHQASEVLESDDEGRPLRARMKVRSAGITDEQVVSYTWHDDGVSWTLESANQQRSQDARYTLVPEGDKTRVKFDITIDPLVPLPGFVLRRATKGVMNTATDGLRKRVLSRKSGR
ncbi:SRPBCC family protein [Mycobacterium sp.]|uniref:SRPBCC family protein n=1 Tax=Mycobacterium sp. TaxID=1785 RepID=UPI002B78DA2E|nr:SRPBCC family protein [Mycobacterium sp.]HME49446.1 SRPBCC family protein [Mycobacterium sp.]